MDKPHHPHVIRTWKVERTRSLVHDPQTERHLEKTREAMARGALKRPKQPPPPKHL